VKSSAPCGREELLVKEKAATRARDAPNAERRGLPMVEVDKEYVVEGADGKATLPGRGTTFAAVSRAPYTTILPFKARTGSSTGSVRIRYHDEYED